MREILHESLTHVHLSIDAWTVPHYMMAMLGIVAHFIDKSGQLRSVVLDMQELEGSHSGLNMAEYTMKVVDDYQIRSRLDYLMMDNASSNDTLAYELDVQLCCTNWAPNTHCLRCFAHIMNLFVKAF
jgi:hypothetical protein